jgi:hypothetical protein
LTVVVASAEKKNDKETEMKGKRRNENIKGKEDDLVAASGGCRVAADAALRSLRQHLVACCTCYEHGALANQEKSNTSTIKQEAELRAQEDSDPRQKRGKLKWGCGDKPTRHWKKKNTHGCGHAALGKRTRCVSVLPFGLRIYRSVGVLEPLSP